MDELGRLCARMMGDGPAARAAEQAAQDSPDDRLARIRAVLAACRDLAPAGEQPPAGAQPAAGPARAASTAEAAAAPADAAGAHAPATGDPSADARAGHPGGDRPESLAVAVARELGAAVAGLSERQSALLALRDLLDLSHADIAQVLGAEDDDVVTGLAHARIALRERLRGSSEGPTPCPERDRALRTITCRLDGEQVAPADEDWLIEHLGLCRSCGRLHATMLEAAACYRAWPADAP